MECFTSSTEPLGGKHLELIHLRSVEDVDRYLGSGERKEGKPGIAIAVGAIPGKFFFFFQFKSSYLTISMH